MLTHLNCAGLDPSGYRGNSAARNDENDAMLGGQAQMTDEERFKVSRKCCKWEFLVSRETLVLRRWESETKIGFYQTS